MGLRDGSKGSDDDPYSRKQEHGRNDGGRQRLRLAMAIGVVFIGRFRSHDQALPDDNRAEDIRQ